MRKDNVYRLCIDENGIVGVGQFEQLKKNAFLLL